MINTVEIRNFKGARQLCFTIKETLVLFGVNNAGKTTILQAIAAWSENCVFMDIRVAGC